MAETTMTCCQTCFAEVRFVPVGDDGALGHPATHDLPDGRPCPGVRCLDRQPAAPSECPDCGEPLPLLVRSRLGFNNRRHTTVECIRALRRRLAAVATAQAARSAS
jgi:hypothetical protein